MPQKYLFMTIIILLLALIYVSVQPKNIEIVPIKKPVEITDIQPKKEIPPPFDPSVDYIEVVPEIIKEKKLIYANTIKEALEIAKKEDKKVLLFFHAHWCHACNDMLSYFTSPNVDKALSNYVIVKLNTDVNRAESHKYNIYGIPRYFQLDKDGKILKDGTGYIPPEQFVTWLK